MYLFSPLSPRVFSRAAAAAVWRDSIPEEHASLFFFSAGLGKTSSPPMRTAYFLFFFLSFPQAAQPCMSCPADGRPLYLATVGSFPSAILPPPSCLVGPASPDHFLCPSSLCLSDTYPPRDASSFRRDDAHGAFPSCVVRYFSFNPTKRPRFPEKL